MSKLLDVDAIPFQMGSSYSPIGFGSEAGTKEKESILTKLNTAKNATVYNMNHESRGLAIVFINKNFDPKKLALPSRPGTEHDRDKLIETLMALSFDVKVYEDKKMREMEDILQDASFEDHTNNDCILIAVMTHGEEGIFFSYDSTYRPEKLWYNFTADKCPSLAGKPKIFLMQACRGKQEDRGSRVEYCEIDSIPFNKLPNHADFLFLFSSYPGYVSYIRENHGSWFIQSLCEVLDQFASTQEIMSNLALINRIVALDYESRNKHPFKANMKQVPCVVSTLTRELYFQRKP